MKRLTILTTGLVCFKWNLFGCLDKGQTEPPLHSVFDKDISNAD